MVKSEDKRLLLRLARRSLEYFMDNHQKLEPDLGGIPFGLCEDKGVFVTLFTKSGQLRGCIGYTDPIKPIWKAVIENSVNAAFYDSRYKALQRNELDNLILEIAILSDQRKLSYTDSDDLLSQLDSSRGVIIKRGMHSATYLPDVWETFSSKEEFLENLCTKAGLKSEAWRGEKLEIFTYSAEIFSEDKY